MMNIIKTLSKIRRDSFFKFILKNNPLLALKLIFFKSKKRLYFKFENEFNDFSISKKIKYGDFNKWVKRLKSNKKYDLSENKLLNIKSIGLENINSIDIDNCILNFAGQKTKFLDLSFENKYSDSEIGFQIHRFFWLVEMLELSNDKENYKKLVEKIKLWIRCFKSSKINKEYLNDVYSVSQRISYLLIFIMSAPSGFEFEGNFIKSLNKIISGHLNYVINNLEFHGKYTNNHVIVNAKSILLCGIVYEDELLIECGNKIIEIITGKIIRNGVLQEGSSSYQMIVCMNLLEIIKISEIYNVLNKVKYIRNVASKMLYVCKLLQSSKKSEEIPVFGDVSPDVKLNFLIGTPFSGTEMTDKSKWNKVYNIELNPKTRQEFSQSYFEKISFNDCEVWINAKNNENISHNHNDNGSITIFNKGIPIITDLGRNNYSELIDDSKSEVMHNFISLENMYFDVPFNSVLHCGNIYSKYYRKKADNKSIQFDIESFDKKIVGNRNIELFENKVVITDRIIKNEYSNVNLVNYNWIFADDDIEFDHYTKKFYSNNNSTGNFTFKFIQQNEYCKLKWEINKIKRYKEYGKSVSAKIVNVKTKLFKNSFLRLVLEFGA